MTNILNVYKPQGKTPLEIIQLLRKKFPEYKDEKIGYAGRLDPLAHGVLLLMVGEETTKQKDKYLNLSKEYEFEVLFGIETDTYDVLGLLKNPSVIASEAKQSPTESQQSRGLPRSFSVARNDIEDFIKSKLGKQIQIYPPYSSKAVNGKPLHWWTRENRLSEIKMPEREIEIYDLKLLAIKQITKQKLKAKIMQQIASVEGDFRQKEIKEKWDLFFATNKNTTFQIARFKIFCSSGTYVRSLVHELGEKLGTGAIALEILRTKVGEYTLKNSVELKN